MFQGSNRFSMWSALSFVRAEMALRVGMGRRGGGSIA